MGIAGKCVLLPDNITRIDELAFANCPNLQGICIPDNCSFIASNAFEGVDGLIIWSTADSYAESFAEQFGFDFIPIQ